MRLQVASKGLGYGCVVLQANQGCSVLGLQNFHGLVARVWIRRLIERVGTFSSLQKGTPT